MAMKHDLGYSGMCLYCGQSKVKREDECPARAKEKPPRAIIFKPDAASPENITITNHPVGSAQATIDPTES